MKNEIEGLYAIHVSTFHVVRTKKYAESIIKRLEFFQMVKEKVK